MFFWSSHMNPFEMVVLIVAIGLDRIRAGRAVS